MHGMHGAAYRKLHLQHHQADQDHPADIQEQSLEMLPHDAVGAIHVAQNQDERSQVHRQNSGGQQHVRRADDLDVEAVGIVPPVVERRRSDHGDAAPGRQKRAQRPAESPDAHGTIAQAGAAVERGGKYQVSAGNARQNAAQMDDYVGRRPKGVASDGAVPGDVPVDAHHGTRHRRRGAPHIPRHALGSYGNRSSSQPVDPLYCNYTRAWRLTLTEGQAATSLTSWAGRRNWTATPRWSTEGMVMMNRERFDRAADFLDQAYRAAVPQ